MNFHPAVKKAVPKRKGEAGQATLLVILAMSVFLLGAVGLAIDGSHLYAQRQMAQAAADAGAQAGIVDMFHGTNASGANAFTATAGSSFTCSTSDPKTPCYYAQTFNGFNAASDIVSVNFPTSVAGVPATCTAPNPCLDSAIAVTVQRTVDMTLTKFLGLSTLTVEARGTAAIVNVISPIPMLITHPTLKDAFQLSGGTLIKIVNGPKESIQVNSCAGTGGTGCGATEAINVSGGNGTCPEPTGTHTCVDLSTGGPGGTAGVFGSGGLTNGSPTNTWPTGGAVLECASGEPCSVSPAPNPLVKFVEPDPAITDPLAWVTEPTQPATNAPTACVALSTGGTCSAAQAGTGNNETYAQLGCAATPGGTANTKNQCTVYYPGYYPSGISVGGGNFGVFVPGVYYLGLTSGNNLNCSPCSLQMATGATASTGTGGTGTGVVFYSKANGDFNIQGGNSTLYLQGDTTGNWGGILFFEGRSVTTKVKHNLSGGGGMNMTGTIYLTMGASATATAYNTWDVAGGSCSTTSFSGEIIVDTINGNGGGCITMNLSGGATYIRQIALVQ